MAVSPEEEKKLTPEQEALLLKKQELAKVEKAKSESFIKEHTKPIAVDPDCWAVTLTGNTSYGAEEREARQLETNYGLDRG